MLTEYILEYAPSPRDKNRYKVSVSCTEEDVKELVKKLSNISSRPFSCTDKNYDWSFFLYDLTDDMKLKIETELTNAVSSAKKTKSEPVNETPAADSSLKRKVEADPAVVVSRLKPEYTFENFVVGASTRFTYAACKSVAESPGKNYNPLFIYGGVGLGKTHLMHSIGNRVGTKNPDFYIAYITTGEFVREVVDSTEKGQLNDLRKKYNEIDLLLIDDIQFLEKSESTQEEFFNIFNEMYERKKQIVITSDKPPKRLGTLEDRLKSRFEWGLTTDIKSPNYETRKAIINKKCSKVNIELDEDISDYIAERLTSNVRELEGIINRIYAYQQLSHDEVTIEFVKDVIKNFLPEEERETLEDEQKASEKNKFPKQNAQQQVYNPPPAVQPVQPVQYVPPQQAMNMCPRCRSQLTFIPNYQKWYCMSCGVYTDSVQQFPAQPFPPQQAHIPAPVHQSPQKICHKCNMPLRFINEYNRFYCDNCREYENIAPPPQSVPVQQEEPVMKSKTSKKSAAGNKQKNEEDRYDEKIIGEEKENTREIKAGYFLPENSDEVLEKVIGRLSKISKIKKFNFYIRPLFTHYFPIDLLVNPDKIAHMCKTNDIDIAICLIPGEGWSPEKEKFKQDLTNTMEKEKIPFEIISESEMKESNALNFMLDIAICAKKRD